MFPLSPMVAASWRPFLHQEDPDSGSDTDVTEIGLNYIIDGHSTLLMSIDEQNKKGGLLGKKIEAVVVDPASNWPLFAEKARELIQKEEVAAIFGCWTSVSRKSVLPAVEELNGLLFYPVQYEGEESSRNVFYTGAAPNQQAIPAVDYLMNEGKVKRCTATPMSPFTRSSAIRACPPPTFRSSPFPWVKRSCRASTPNRWSATLPRGIIS